MSVYIATISSLGSMLRKPVESLGVFLIFTAKSILAGFKPRLEFRLLSKQMEFVGNKSFWIVILAGTLIGGIFGLQLGDLFKIFNAESMMAAAAGYTLTKELAPVIGSMLVTGRAGSAMTAEIAIMRVNEQIDAMNVMGINPYNYLVAPRIFASAIMMPILTAIFVLSGVFTSLLVGLFFYDIDIAVSFDKIRMIVSATDLIQGLEKAVIFGILFSSIGCYKGFYAIGGAKGVGEATTYSVVFSFVAILLSDFLMSYLQYQVS